MQCTPDGRFVTFVQNAVGHQETRIYDKRFGGATQVKGPNNLATNSQFDKLGRKFCETRPDGSTTGWGWAQGSGSVGLIASTFDSTYPQGTPGNPLAKAEQHLDRLGREVVTKTRAFNNSWSSVTTTYDGRGRKTRVNKPFASTYANVDYAYDDLDRVTSETGPAGYAATSTYAGLTSTVTVTGQSGAQTTTKTVNNRGEVVSVVDALGSTLQLQYDHFGNLERKSVVASAQGGSLNPTRILYNARGQKTRTEDPDQGAWTYAHNSAGELTQQTDAMGNVTTILYDGLGRMVQRDAAGYVSEWIYDYLNNQSCGSKSLGKPCRAISPWATQDYRYDSLGRPSSVKLTVADGRVFERFTAYDGMSRVRQVVFPYTNLTLDYTYTGQGFLDKITEPGATAYFNVSSRHADGQVASYTVRGQTINKTYDAAGRPNNISTSTLQNSTFGFDALGNLTSRSDSITGLSETLQYDKLNRLTSAARSGGTDSYTYDALGNLKTKNGLALGYQAGTHRVVSHNGRTFSYDANGRIENPDDYSFGLSYLASGNLYSIFTVDGGTGGMNWRDIWYDAAGQRVQEMSGKELDPDYFTRTYYFSEGITPFFEEETVAPPLPTDPRIIRWKHYINTPEGIVGMVVINNDLINSRSDVIFARDHLGSTVGTLTFAGTNSSAERVGYDSWGTPRDANGDPNANAALSQTNRGFTGHETYSDAGIVNMNGRVYAPWLGRVLAPDPIVQAPLNLQSYNRYSYVINNPLSLTDPSGLSWWKDNGQGAARIIGAAVVAYITGGAASSWYVSYANAALCTVGATPIIVGSVSTTASIVYGAVGGFAAGGIMGGNLSSAAYGALSGGLGGLVAGADLGPFAQRAASAAIGGAISAAQGGGFARGASPALAMYLFGEFLDQLPAPDLEVHEVERALSNPSTAKVGRINQSGVVGVNGILNEVGNAISNLGKITGADNLTLIYNPTQSFIMDGIETMRDIFGNGTKASRQLRGLLEDASGRGLELTVYGHSQGGAMLYRALTLGPIQGVSAWFVGAPVPGVNARSMGGWLANPNDAVPMLIGGNGTPSQMWGSLMAVPRLFGGCGTSTHDGCAYAK
jgi:RHS repeat-associated protein